MKKTDPPIADPLAQINHLAGQIQALATRLEGLREKGAGDTAEFRSLEALLRDVQEKLLAAEARVPGA